MEPKNFPAELPRDDSMDMMQMDVYLVSGQHYQVVITLNEVHTIRRMWRDAAKGTGDKHTLYMFDRLESQVAEVRFVYIASITHKPAPADAVKGEFSYN